MRGIDDAGRGTGRTAGRVIVMSDYQCSVDKMKIV